MAIRNCAKYCAAALVAVACTVQAPVEEQAPTTSEPVLSSAFAPGVATLEFDDALIALIEEDLAAGNVVTKSEALNGVLADLGIEHLERLFPEAGIYEARTREAGLHRFYKVKFSEQTPVTKAVTDLGSVPGVLSVTPSRRIHPRAAFNDPLLAAQWHLVNTRTMAADIHLQEVWQNYTVGSSQVIVAVTDEAVDYSHPDLAANMWTDGNGHYGYNGFTGTVILTEPSRLAIGHGTHVAGIISAVNNNELGVSSVAGGDAAAGIPGVRIMSCEVLSGYDEDYDNAPTNDEGEDMSAANAIKWSADHGAVISQNSWGYIADGFLDGEFDGIVSQEELDAYKKYGIRNMPALKAAIDYFIRYAGCDARGNQRSDSPMKGGLVFFAAGNEDIDYDMVGSYSEVISVGATQVRGDRSTYSNYGSWVDIAAPGGSSDFPVWSTLPTQISYTGYGGYDSDGASWTGTSMACPHASGTAALIISYFGGPGFTAEACRDILLSGLGDVVGGNKPIGGRLDALAAFEYGAAHYPVGGGGETSPTAPVLRLETDALSIKAHESVTIGFTAYDPNGDSFTLDCEPGSEALSFNASGRTLRIDGWKVPAGTYTAKVTATDKGGLSTTRDYFI